jgi:hypothetical protein
VHGIYQEMSAPPGQSKGPNYDPSIMAESYAQWEKSLEIEIQRTFDVVNRDVLESNMARDLARLKDPQVDPDFLCTWTVRFVIVWPSLCTACNCLLRASCGTEPRC